MIKKSAALIVQNNKLLVVKKKNYNSHYILPGGKLEFGETSYMALKRELKEELNINIKSYEFIDVSTYIAQFENIEMEIYLFKVMIEGELEISNEIIALDWININQKNERNDLATGITKYTLSYLRKE